jgi:dephospho-CoA kinase
VSRESRPLTLSIALTGNIGAGKSTVAELFRSWGATIIDADRLVREIQAPGQPALADIEAEFGKEVIAADGALDRAVLRARVLDDAGALARLNRIVHPEVHRRRMQLLEQARARGDRIVISDIPLLFEVDDPTSFDAVILVDAPEAIRRARLLASRPLNESEADRMLAAQLSSNLKRGRSDYIIENNGDRAALERAARVVWQKLTERA